MTCFLKCGMNYRGRRWVAEIAVGGRTTGKNRRLIRYKCVSFFSFLTLSPSVRLFLARALHSCLLLSLPFSFSLVIVVAYYIFHLVVPSFPFGALTAPSIIPQMRYNNNWKVKVKEVKRVRRGECRGQDTGQILPRWSLNWRPGEWWRARSTRCGAGTAAVRGKVDCQDRCQCKRWGIVHGKEREYGVGGSVAGGWKRQRRWESEWKTVRKRENRRDRTATGSGEWSY